MKKFILKILLLLLPPVVFLLAFFSLADGHTDPFYKRFTSPQQKNLILGTSRAAQGLQPEVFENLLKDSFYNYSFTVAHSPYGPVYFESAKRKHSKEKGGIFILTVDPWSISSWTKSPNDVENFRENKLCLSNTKIVNLNPNFIYLYQNFKGEYKNILLKPMKNMFLHDDGWLEIKNIDMDSTAVSLRIKEKESTYRETYLPQTLYSQLRNDYLLKTVNYFKEYGEVYIVRLPVHQEIFDIEQELMPDFDKVIKRSIDNADGYLDLTKQNDTYQYTDGNHLYTPSGKEVSNTVANWIKTKRLKN